jgi:hypothetical protein
MPDRSPWYCVKPAKRFRRELDLPMWTWASAFDRVRFFDIKCAKKRVMGPGLMKRRRCCICSALEEILVCLRLPWP